MDRWVFELEQGGIVVASGSGPKEAMLREAMHYTMIYGQDGPVKTIVRQEHGSGCNLCDLDDDAEIVGGIPMHAIDNDIVGNAGHVPCTKLASQE